jgi:hypothetical protein
MHGATPSYTRQTENDMKNQQARAAADAAALTKNNNS